MVAKAPALILLSCCRALERVVDESVEDVLLFPAFVPLGSTASGGDLEGGMNERGPA